MNADAVQRASSVPLHVSLPVAFPGQYYDYGPHPIIQKRKGVLQHALWPPLSTLSQLLRPRPQILIPFLGKDPLPLWMEYSWGEAEGNSSSRQGRT